MKLGKVETFNIIANPPENNDRYRFWEETKFVIIPIKGFPLEDINPLFPKIMVHRTWFPEDSEEPRSWTASEYLSGRTLMKQITNTKMEAAELVIGILANMTIKRFDIVITLNHGKIPIINPLPE